MIEIERKYLVKSNNWKSGLTEADSSFIQQGYLNRDPDRVVRIRTRDSKAFLTIKGRATGITRSEFEYPISINDAQELLGMCLGNVLIKRRYEIEYKGNTWEVDEFLGKNKGLILAEIELKSEDQSFDIPEWVGKEVTKDMKYTNLALAQNDS
ncbi:MAG: CYTH domain-containing protein [Bacteroidota bacterium]|nr:CYTH domain-containing protein [Bacteroidota bacterium]